MADDKTEAATPRRRRKARDEGQVARSRDVVGCLILMGVIYCLPQFGHSFSEKLSGFFEQTLSVVSRGPVEADTLGFVGREAMMRVASLAGPVLCMVMAIAVAGNVAQVGLRISPKSLEVKMDRLDPIAGFKRLLSTRSAIELLKGMLKMILVVWAGWAYVAGHQDAILTLSLADPQRVGPATAELAYGLAARMVATLAFVAALDYAYQRWSFEKTLRMSKHEIKEELRESDGNPQLKAKIRKRQRQISRGRMMAEVPKATVIITNPTHFAVALRYDAGQGGAPRMLAKGQDLIALRIREIAEEHRIPIVENPPLARSIFHSVELNQEIPPNLYRAVAEVLAMIWKVDPSRRAR